MGHLLTTLCVLCISVKITVWSLADYSVCYVSVLRSLYRSLADYAVCVVCQCFSSSGGASTTVTVGGEQKEHL